MTHVKCPRCNGHGDLCRGCSGLANDYPELFGGCGEASSIVVCPVCKGGRTVPTGTKCRDLKTRQQVVA